MESTYAMDVWEGIKRKNKKKQKNCRVIRIRCHSWIKQLCKHTSQNRHNVIKPQAEGPDTNWTGELSRGKHLSPVAGERLHSDWRWSYTCNYTNTHTHTPTPQNLQPRQVQALWHTWCPSVVLKSSWHTVAWKLVELNLSMNLNMKRKERFGWRRVWQVLEALPHKTGL